MKKRLQFFDNPFMGYLIFFSIILICIASYFVEWLWFLKEFLSLLGKEVIALFVLVFIIFTYSKIKDFFSILKRKSLSPSRKILNVIFENLTYLIYSEIIFISFLCLAPLILNDMGKVENPMFYVFIWNIIILPFVFYYLFFSQFKILKKALISDKEVRKTGLDLTIKNLASKINQLSTFYKTSLECYFFPMSQEIDLMQKQKQIKNVENQLSLILKIQEFEENNKFDNSSEIYLKLLDEYDEIKNNFYK